MLHARFLKSAPALLAGSLLFFGATAAHAQGFTFTAPTTTTFTAAPGDIINFAGTFKNTTFVAFNGVTINLGPAPGSYPGKFIFTSLTPTNPPDLSFGSFFKFTGQLKISKTATFTSQTFYLNASGSGDDGTGSPQDVAFASDNFTVKLVPKAVPEASTTITFGLLLGGLGLLAVRARKRSAA